MRSKEISAVASLLLAAGIALGQVEVVAWTADGADEFGFFSTDAGVGVNGQAVVATGNMQMTLLDKAGTILDSRNVDVPNSWPFRRIDTSQGTGSLDFPSRFFDPQVEYHTQSGRLWMIYSETNSVRTGSGGTQVFGNGQDDLSALHIAISKSMVAPNTLDSFNTSDWWIYSDDQPIPGYAGLFFDLKDNSIQRYRSNGPDTIHLPYPPPGGLFSSGKVDKPQFAVDEQAAYIASVGGAVPTGGSRGSSLLVIPTSHGSSGTLSILDGQKPPASTWTFMVFKDLGSPESGGVADLHQYHYVVQEPIENTLFENVQFVISLPSGGPNNDLRLGAMWFDSQAGRWQYTQRRSAPSVLDDPNVGAGFDYFARAKAGYNPQTPDPNGWEPSVVFGLINGVLAFDTNNNPRIFAVHHMGPVDDSANPAVAEEQFAIQWYVIDPDLNDVYNTGVGQWQPNVIATGRLDGPGDRYHPAIGVTPQGTAYIEYTYSSPSVWPEVRRAQLNSTYTGVLSEITIQAGVATAYDEPNQGWADFNEMQLDPDRCRLWSVDTLVHADTSGGTPPATTLKRDVWLFENRFAELCFTPDFNRNLLVDPGDAILFNYYFVNQDTRADVNADGDVNAIDAAIFLERYTAGTP